MTRMRIKVGKDTRHRKSRCPSCGYVVDAATCVQGEDDDDGPPEPGCITICLQCSHLCAYGHNMRLRELTDDEIILVAGDERIIQAMEALAAMRRAYERQFGKPWTERHFKK